MAVEARLNAQVGAKANTFLSHLENDLSPALRFVPDLFIGGGEAIRDMATGIAVSVSHPIRTGKSLWFLVTKLVSHPGDTLKLLGHAFADPYVEAWESGHPGRAVGMGLVEVGSLFVTPGDVVSMAKGGMTFAMATEHGLQAGEGLSRSLDEAILAAKYSSRAARAARDGELLARVGCADESKQMSLYAEKALQVSDIAKSGRGDLLAAALDKVAPEQSILVGDTEMTYAAFLQNAHKLLRWSRFLPVTGHVPKQVYRVASAAKEASDATKLAEVVLGGGSMNPGFWGEMARAVERNPQLVAPVTPILGLIPDTLGRIGAVPKNLPFSQGVTPAIAAAIASQYNLEDSLDNVRAFVREIRTYNGGTIGPDTGRREQIQELQALLAIDGYSVSASGEWDRATGTAIMEFKRNNGLHQSYRLANGSYAVNEYADSATVSKLLDKVNDATLRKAVASKLRASNRS